MPIDSNTSVFYSILSLAVLIYFRGRIALRASHQDKKIRVKLIQGSPVAGGHLPEQVDQLEQVHKLNRIADSDCLFSSIQINLLTNDVYNYNNNLQQQ